jgi:hypothetical protein
MSEPFYPQPEYVDQDGNLRLPVAKFWQWRALEAEVQKFGLLKKAYQRQFEDLLKQNPELVRLREMIHHNRQMEHAKSVEHDVLMKEIIAGVGVEVQGFVIDDETGLVKVID